MSLKVIKAGIQDTIQDPGRYGYQWLGVNPGGVMDPFAARMVNMLVGNDPDEAVLELHFPAGAFLLEQDTLLAIGGANFNPSINGEPIPLWHPVIANQNSVIQFDVLKSGARCYVAIKGGFGISRWMNSYSTHLKAGIGGYLGRALQRADIIQYRKQHDFSSFLQEKDRVILPWAADILWDKHEDERVHIIPGNEWDWISGESKEALFSQGFQVLPASDRMGYRLEAPPLVALNHSQLVSSAVNFGTLQLLPEGQLIVLMADHQTTGGYPRIAHVISAHLSKLAQRRAGDIIHFRLTDLDSADELWNLQQQHLLQLQNACKFRLEEFLK